MANIVLWSFLLPCVSAFIPGSNPAIRAPAGVKQATVERKSPVLGYEQASSVGGLPDLKSIFGKKSASPAPAKAAPARGRAAPARAQAKGKGKVKEVAPRQKAGLSKQRPYKIGGKTPGPDLFDDGLTTTERRYIKEGKTSALAGAAKQTARFRFGKGF